MNQLVIAGGCFWGLEELFRYQLGVQSTEVGYAGGNIDNPTFEFHPGHAEALNITFNVAKTSMDRLLDYFFIIHDPTTLNRQGNDVGESYRSAIFYGDPIQREAAERAISRATKIWSRPIVTTIEPLIKFWAAESYHQDYLQKHPGGYTCHYERR